MATAPPTGISAAPTAPSLLERHPRALLPLCGAVVLGIYAGANGLDWRLSLLSLPLAAPIARRSGRSTGLLAVGCVLLLALGGWREASVAYHDGPLVIGHYIGRSVAIDGLVDGEAQPSGGGENLPVAVISAQVDGRVVPAGGRILVHYTGPQSLEYGDRLTLKGTLSAPFGPPGSGYRAYLARQSIYAVLQYPSLRLAGRGEGNPIQAVAERVRSILRATIVRMLPHDEAALLAGILLGAPTRSLGALTAAFIAVGLIHVVAISGLKVALIAGAVGAACRTLPMRWRWPPALLAVCGYTLITGATPSGLRSALMWALALLALQTGRRSYVWASLALVAAAMTCWQPTLLWDTGFQLSVAGTAGIVLFAVACERPFRWLRPRLLRESLAVTLAAQIATLPITAMGFGQVSPAGPLANALLLPLLGPIIALGGLAALAGSLAPPLATPLATVVHPLLVIFIWAVRALAALPLASVAWTTVPAWLLLPYYALLAAVARAVRRWEPETRPPPAGIPFARRWGLLAAGVLLAGTAISLWGARPGGEATLRLAAAGHGEIAVLQAPGAWPLLIDGGDDPAALQAALGAALPFDGRALAAVLVSTPDRAHLGGLVGLSARYTVGRGIDPGAIYPSIAYAHWRAALRDDGIAELKARTGQRFDLGGGAYLDVLLPTGPSPDGQNAPVAYRLRAGRLAVLLLNSAAALGETAPLRADGACLDMLVLPAAVDAGAAAALVRALEPRLVLLPPAPPVLHPALANLTGLPRGTRQQRLQPGHDLRLGSADGHCT